MRKLAKVATLAVAAVMTLGLATAEEVAWSGSEVVREGTVGGGGSDKITFEGLGIDYSKVDKVEVEITNTADFVNGGLGANTIADDGWGQSNYEVKDAHEGTITWESIGGLLVADDGTCGLQMQFWWINPIYNEDGEDSGEAGVVTVKSVKMYDADGNVLYPAADAPAETPDAPTEDAPATDNAPATGDATSVIALGAVALLALAGVAFTKKNA